MSFVCGNAYADGITELKNSLAKLQGNSALKAVLEAKSWNRQGEGENAEEMQATASVSVSVEDGARGMQVLYSKDLLSRLQSEDRAKEKNSNVKMLVSNTSKEFNSSALLLILSAAANLSHRLDAAIFKNEKLDTFNNKPARLLTFDIPVNILAKKIANILKPMKAS